MINWRAPLSIIQMLNGDLTYDDAEKELLNKFKEAGLYEKISEVEYTVEKEKVETDEWVIDTGGNPSGVGIRKYKNGWWNGSNFYGFGRLK